MSPFDEALQGYKNGLVSKHEYMDAWMEEFRFCYSKHGGHRAHFKHTIEPCHWVLNVSQDAEGTDMFGTSAGAVTFPAQVMHPETAALALIAYEGAVIAEGLERCD